MSLTMRRKLKRNKLQQLRASVMRVRLKLKQILLRTSFSSLLLIVVHVASCTTDYFLDNGYKLQMDSPAAIRKLRKRET